MLYAEWDSCVSANLDLWAWDNDVYSRAFKVKVMAFTGLRSLVKTHTDDAVSRKLETRGK